MALDERITQRGERIKKLISETEQLDKKFKRQLSTFSTSAKIFDGTKTALLTGSGELELF